MKKKVKITQCSRPKWWYADCIGQTFEVYGEKLYDDVYDHIPNCYYTYKDSRDISTDSKHFIAPEDCIIVKEQGGEPMSYITREDYEKLMDAVEEIKNKDIKNVTININISPVDEKQQAEKVIQILTEQLAKLSLT
jgi:PHD/YefM family antitoxin component YafN of YafNO toxin-antitoxin module